MAVWQNYITALFVRANRPEYLEVESEEKVDTDEKESYFAQRSGKSR
jgi:hypothetical protein